MRVRILLSILVLVAVADPLRAGTPGDPFRERQWGLSAISAEGAWERATGRKTLIAVVDTGIDLDHPDLSAKIVVHKGGDFVDRERCKDHRCLHDGPVDHNGHGTHVAGIAAAQADNGVGIAGVAPDAELLPVRVLDAEGNGSAHTVALGIRFAADHGADVINLSLGVFSGSGPALKIAGRLDEVYEAVDYAWSLGAVVVVAAGNDTFPLCSEPSAHPRAICVGATDENNLRSWYSNSDATMSSDFFVAPGGRGLRCPADVFSTFPTWRRGDCGEEKGYEAMSGTSMAAPFVSGLAALLVEEGLSQEQIRRCLIRSSSDLGTPGRDPVYGYGLIDAATAVSAC